MRLFLYWFRMMPAIGHWDSSSERTQLCTAHADMNLSLQRVAAENFTELSRRPRVMVAPASVGEVVDVPLLCPRTELRSR